MRPAQALVSRPAQGGRRGGLGSKRGGFGAGGGGKAGDAGHGKSAEADVRMSEVDGAGTKKSNADFRALFVKGTGGGEDGVAEQKREA